MKIHDSISINADRTRVFEAFCDLDNAPINISGITKIEVLAGSSTLNIGTKWRETRKMFGQEATEEMWVTAYEQDVPTRSRRSRAAPTTAANTDSPRSRVAHAST